MDSILEAVLREKIMLITTERWKQMFDIVYSTAEYGVEHEKCYCSRIEDLCLFCKAKRFVKNDQEISKK